MKGNVLSLGALILAVAGPLTGGRTVDSAPALKADRVFLNGRIWTGDRDRPWAEALAVRGPTILAIGRSAEVRKTAERLTEVVDLKGRFVAPGFEDAHLHFLVRDEVELDGADTVEEVQRRIGEYARAHPDAPWLIGRGWGYASFPANTPDKKYLDVVVPDRALLLTDRDHHSALANTVALAAAGVDRQTRDPEHGVVVRDSRGEPTGLLKEAAMGLVARRIPPPTDEERYRSLKQLLDRAASYGLTSVHNASYPDEDLRTYERVMREGGLKVRFYVAVPFRKNATEKELAPYQALRERYRGPLLKFGAAKGLLDGVIDAQTAAMFEPFTTGAHPPPAWTAEELNRTAVAYDKAGFQILLHACGDKAIHMALDAYEHAARVNGTSGRRHRVEHVEVPIPADLPRFKALGVIASTQALFANPDKTTLENFAVLLGPERSARAEPFARLDAAGAVQAFGSDWPVFSMETLRGIYCAVTRKTPEGAPSVGWYPENRISAEAALRHFTADAAYASFDEGAKGTLAPGRLADFVVLSDDILAPPPERILKARVLLTVLGGRDTYRSPDF
jgi:predicted amidohydrolase YtcJ